MVLASRLAIVAVFAASGANAQLSPETQAKVDAATQKIVTESGVPSASVGIIKDGKIVYTQAFGFARITPPLPAASGMAYAVGSISKQFTATAILLLQQQNKLKLDDPVSKFFPELTRATDITIRNLLTHTSGYQDYAPQDYTIPEWRLPGDPLRIVHQYAGKPLDFEPGTQWQYSNTNFVLAALIVQKVSGEPFAKFLRDNIIRPAGLEHVLNLNTDQSQLQVLGYKRYALAPLRPTPLEAPGWYFGDGDLAMPAASLLKWDLTIINQSLLTPGSYKEFETPFVLKNGKDSGYGLGVSIRTVNGRRMVEHSGEVGGFVAENVVFPDDKLAIVVLTNQDASAAAGDIARAILPLVQPAAAATDTPPDTFGPKLQTILTGLQKGHIDRALFTANCNDYFNKDALTDFASSLAPLGAIKAVINTRTSLRGGMNFSVYHVTFSGGTVITVTVYLMPDGKIEQLLVVGIV